ncbi:glycosyltransferase family 2 protein [Segatella bryantii]|uniref:Glycosyltransferase family 2 protein n=1 Tax=Segatella bryantii TaxID=77095 RepID=A0ABX4EJ23_SEGBR|nr:glycosyltransferase family 2 protein [Segatella bryantii]OYP56309.1 glycosyltransferase family 2 protein [Segatella bryantii]UKK80341.1 glycosyltransferase family 2 protein [Segatella bryantii]SDM01847.1 rhamnosyltransferase [Segatella bryantii]
MIKNNKSIALLLATYNGESYLREQLDSLYAQTNQDWSLFVRDDCSTDATCSILSEYQTRYGNIVIINNHNKNLGPQHNFMTLLKEVDSEYYMFVDDDDYWFPQKIENEIKKIKEIEEKNKPALVITNLKITDGNLHITHESYWKSIGFNPEYFNTFKDEVFIGYVTGCTMLFNQPTKAFAFPVADYSPMHDWWIAKCAYTHGNVGYIKEPQMFYRKYGKNVTGNYVSSQRGKSFSLRVKEMIKQYKLLKISGCVSSFPDYLISKYKLNKKRKLYK